METRKEMILAALTAFVRQRSGIDPGNYVNPHDGGDAFAAGVRALRSDQRSITRDLRDYRALRLVVGLRTDITADDLVAAFRDAYSGRLSLVQREKVPGQGIGPYALDYCTGQYFPTEYRKAACAVLASALWVRKRGGMPTPLTTGQHTTYLFHKDGHKSPDAMSAGDWLRASFRREFGRGIASRYFS